MNATIYRYPLDPTGVNPNNLVANEEHQLSNRTIRCVAPKYGGFYATGVSVVDAVTNIPLIKGIDYTFGELFEFPTGRYGQEVFGIVIIKKTTVSKIKLTYQALGGDYSYNMDAIIAMIDNLNLGDRPVAWPDIIGRPNLFNPASHFHDLGDVYGFEYVVHALERLRQAILLGDVASHDEIYRYIDSWGDNLQDLSAALRAEFEAHRDNRNNPHGTTATHVGLGNVMNYGLATQIEAEAGTLNTKYMTPLLVSYAIAKQALIPLNAHIARTDNPHNTTKAQVGLPLVDNFATAIQAESEAGTLNTRFMTPLQTAFAIAKQALIPLNAHISRVDNPHGVNKTQVGLGLVDNFATATNSEAVNGIVNNAFMTPLRVKEAIFAMALTNTNFQTTVQGPSFLANTGYGPAGGYSFRGDGSFDTGMFSTGDGHLALNSNGVNVINMVAGASGISINRRIDSPAIPMAMAQEWNTPGGLQLTGTGTGDYGMAGLSLTIPGYYGIRMGLRADGYFGIGGASRVPWSWYTDSSGNSVSQGDVVAYSDPRLKDGWELIEDPFELLMKVQGWKFVWREGIKHIALKAGKADYGFNALDVQKIAPELVHGSIEIDGEVYLTVAYDKFAPFFSRAIVMLKEAYDEQQQEIAELKDGFKQLSEKVGKMAIQTARF